MTAAAAAAAIYGQWSLNPTSSPPHCTVFFIATRTHTRTFYRIRFCTFYYYYYYHFYRYYLYTCIRVQVLYNKLLYMCIYAHALPLATLRISDIDLDRYFTKEIHARTRAIMLQ